MCPHMGEGCPVPWTRKGLAWCDSDLLGGQWAAQVAAGLIDVDFQCNTWAKFAVTPCSHSKQT